MTTRTQNNHLMSEEEKNGFMEISQTFDWLYEPIIRTISKYLPNSYSLADIGCANGTLIKRLKREFLTIKYTGIDLDQFFIEKAKEYDPNNSYFIEDVNDLETEADIIISNLSLHHFIDPHRALNNMSENSQKVIIISDQIRPETDKELEKRLDRREDFLRQKYGDNYEPPFYNRKKEELSILESYSKREIEHILTKLGLPYKITFLDNDYYERFVVEIQK